eukprot:TRINITY_DN5157_c0_g1_i1.p1 TRINITY_DN5157_c0_g1~~TRINITY_DN5157_c0_g1_i1.p1  ORF type:complete len:221 (-),score=29.45 TRINITY_DN5157_c0_g1_i1:147-752(-)
MGEDPFIKIYDYATIPKDAKVLMNRKPKYEKDAVGYAIQGSKLEPSQTLIGTDIIRQMQKEIQSLKDEVQSLRQNSQSTQGRLSRLEIASAAHVAEDDSQNEMVNHQKEELDLDRRKQLSQCFNCGKVTKKRCGSCNRVKFCGVECQRAASVHKLACWNRDEQKEAKESEKEGSEEKGAGQNLGGTVVMSETLSTCCFDVP